MSTYGLVTILGVFNHVDGFFGDDEEVDRCLWVDVIKCEHFVVFEDNLGRNLLVNDLLEDRGALGRSDGRLLGFLDFVRHLQVGDKRSQQLVFAREQ